ncbi:MAG: glycosyltransferase family 4 protein [Bacteroidota bacterium]
MFKTSKPNILITSPSINTKHNVSGIANLTRLLFENNSEINYILFTAGKKDNEARGIKWLLKQFGVLLAFKKQINKEEISFAHINMPLEKAAILRDTSFASICRLIKKPYILHLRGGAYSKNKQTPLLLKLLIKKSLKKASQIIVLGNAEKNFICDFYNIKRDRITTLPNCVKVPELNQKEIDKTTKINILYLGRIDRNKGLYEIIQALSTLPTNINYSLSIAGDGPDRDWFIDSCMKNLKTNLKYEGIVSGLSKEKLLAKSHIFLLPSYFEGLPNALLEAMSYSVVPIVTPVGSIPDVVKQKENGLIVNIKDSNEIKNAIELLIQNNETYKQLSRQAYRTITENYSLNNYIIKLNKIYQSII